MGFAIGRREFIGGCLATTALAACSDETPTTVDGGPPADSSPDGPAPDGPAPDGPAPDGPAPDGPAPDGPAPDAGPLPGLLPEPLVGYGASTTGGRGGQVVVVTSLSDDPAAAGSIRWALKQHSGTPLYVCLAVEGEIHLAETLKITRPDVTIDGRFAPGAGCWLTTNRLEIEADNVLLDNVTHFGNDTGANSDSDCLRWGIYDTDPGGTDHVTRGYARRCEFHHGRDEVMAITSRSNGQATGNDVRQVTWERCVIANPTGAGHELGVFIGDGANQVTLYRNLMFNFGGRYPFVRQYARAVELINNASYNFNENCVHVIEDAEVSYRGNLLRLGPRWNDPRAPIHIEASNKTFVDDVGIDSQLGKKNSHGLTWEPPLTSPAFAGSGLTPMPSADVGAAIVADCGARLHGGGRGAIGGKVVGQFDTGDAPAGLATHPGPTPKPSGASYPPHADHVPNDYLAVFSGDTDLGATIADGSAWDGHLVAERVGAWLTRVS